ncbi:MAG TPA: TMEM175 family protein [Steroidobacteraceae bacterium]|nr:TMEM175 family protein [Steroidobacteraceae bacterium]
MGKGRLEAFSDGVIAIIITIMVLELKAPRGAQFDSLGPVIPLFLSYVLSFVYVGIYWNNHHHMLHATMRISGAVLWANLHLLFWLSLIPFTTAWMDENQFAAAPVALYGAVLLMAGVAYYVLAQCLAAVNGRDSALATAFGRDWKGLISIGIYAVGIALSFVKPWIALTLYVMVACIWVIPDRRIEATIKT